MLQKRIHKSLTHLTVYFLVSCFAFFASTHLAHAEGVAVPASGGIPFGFESYESRPDILTLEPKDSKIDSNWQKLKAAHFSFIATLLESYPDYEIYFLARDAEYLFDVARLVTEGSSDFDRVHLLNVSRANMRDPQVKNYLHQHDISEEHLASGKKILLVDTGFSGTISRAIGEKFSDLAKSNLKTQLIVSSNTAHPSSRAFLIHLNPSVNESDPSSLHGTIVTYEHMPRFTDRSNKYVLSNGHIQPLSPIGSSMDGTVSKSLATDLMGGLRAEWLNQSTKEEFLKNRRRARRVFYLLTRESKEIAISEMKALLENQSNQERSYLEAVIRDVIEVLARNGGGTSVTPQDLGLKESEILSDGTNNSKKQALIKKYPDLATYMEDPVGNIPLLFQSGEWQKIGVLIDLNVDYDFNYVLLKHLFDAPATGIKHDLQVAIINKGNPDVHWALANKFFRNPVAVGMGDLIRLVIEIGGAEALRDLARYTFSKPYTEKMEGLVKRLIERGDSITLSHLAQFAFSKPHTAGMHDAVRRMVEKATPEIVAVLKKYVFSKDSTQTPEIEILKIAVEIVDLKARKIYIEVEFKKLGVDSKPPDCADFFKKQL